MSEWYKEWFNTPEYLDVYRHRDDEDAVKLADLIFDVAKPKIGSAVLDMACGAGRHSIIFAKRGMHVTAFDLSDNLLKVAKESSDELNLQIEFLHADLRTFEVPNKFDLVLNLFTSFGYFETDEENFRVFKKAYNHLDEGGVFVFDYFNATYLKNNLVDESVETFNNTNLFQKRSITDGRVEKKIIIQKNGSSQEFTESVKMYDYSILITSLQKVGFKIMKTCGDFFGNKFDELTSSRVIIFVAK
ncbi:MAG: class I SAM-dependent methyltransferase [Ignavibacteriaceae bacterium]|nr:class I SAM-dependent methyltransferase [Ignavibacteriaceae bacterium]